MAEIKCPKCGTTFKVDDSSYADILSQVRGHEFDQELEQRIAALQKQAAADKDLALAKQEAEQAKTDQNQATEIAELKSKIKQLFFIYLKRGNNKHILPCGGKKIIY